MADEWYTPKFIFDALGLKFDVDVCAPKDGIPWLPAKKHYHLEIDGLSQDWQGLVWMNPPYSKPTPWIDKFLDHGNGLALVPFSKSKWFVKLWNSDAVILPLPRNLKFVMDDGSKKQIFMQTLLAGVGKQSIEALKNSGLGKIR